jgi:hypothetical protein
MHLPGGRCLNVIDRLGDLLEFQEATGLSNVADSSGGIIRSLSILRGMGCQDRSNQEL